MNQDRRKRLHILCFHLYEFPEKENQSMAIGITGAELPGGGIIFALFGSICSSLRVTSRVCPVELEGYPS